MEPSSLLVLASTRYSWLKYGHCVALHEWLTSFILLQQWVD